MNGRQLAEAFHEGRRVYGSCIVSTSPLWPAMIAGLGLDLAFIDTEHIPIGRSDLAWMCQMYTALNMAPVVRIPKPDPYQACMVLDGGAAGVVAPYMESVEEVKELRGAVKFRPLKGRRLSRFLDGHEELEPKLAAYLEERNANRLMIVNIESVAALEALEQILAVPDIDALLIGPHDLSLSLGLPEEYGHPTFNEAVNLIIRKARAHNVGVGLHFSFGIEHEIRWAKEGANLILHSGDFFLVRDRMADDFARFREELGDMPPGARDSTHEDGASGVVIV